MAHTIKTRIDEDLSRQASGAPVLNASGDAIELSPIGRVVQVDLAYIAAKGASWSFMGNITVSAISFCGTAVLARLLDPRDFGLIGMAVLITGVVGLFGSFGMDSALIYKKEVDQEYLSTAFWVNMIAGISLAMITLVASPLAAAFFKRPEVKWIAACLSINFIITALSSIHNTLLKKDIKQDKIAFVSIAARSVRVIIMIFCAFNGFRFWSIVIGMVAEKLVVLASFIRIIKWRPSRIFSVKKAKELFHFGKNIYGQVFLNYLNQNMDFILTGRFLGAGFLGFYQFAYNLPYLVKEYVNDSLVPVTFPVLSKMQDDKERVARGFFKAVRFISLIAFPLMAGFCFCANDFIIFVYGAKWLPAAMPMQVLCIGAALAAVNTIVNPVFYSQGRPDIGLKCGVLRIFMTIVFLIIGVKIKGMLGVAYAMFLVECIFVFQAYIATKLIGSSFRHYLGSLYPASVATLVMSFFLFSFSGILLHIHVPGLNLLVSMIIGGTAYVAAIVFFFRQSADEFILFMKTVLS